MNVDVTIYGAVVLGEDIACDGYYGTSKVRIQTHIHQDHMHEFNRSKGEQRIYLTNASKDLLICIENADIPIRSNIVGLDYGEEKVLENCTFKFIDSQHMLGSAQIQATYSNGISVGYSGDFSWPLEDTIEVDILILDSTCGGIFKRREFTREEATARFVEIIHDKINKGPVLVKAHRGTLQRVIDDLSNELNLSNIPVLASSMACKEVGVYRKYGFDLPTLIDKVSDEGKQIIKHESKYIQLYRPKELLFKKPNCTVINCSRHMSDPIDPVCIHGDNSFTVSLTGHADFEGTIEYVRATKAKKVITDNTRGGKAHELANTLQTLLGIEAVPSTNELET